MSAQTAESTPRSIEIPEDGLGSLSLNQLFSPAELGRDIFVAGGDLGRNHKGHLTGIGLGIVLPLIGAEVVHAQDSDPGSSTGDLGVFAALALPFVIGGGNAYRVFRRRFQDLNALGNRIERETRFVNDVLPNMGSKGFAEEYIDECKEKEEQPNEEKEKEYIEKAIKNLPSRLKEEKKLIGDMRSELRRKTVLLPFELVKEFGEGVLLTFFVEGMLFYVQKGLLGDILKETDQFKIAFLTSVGVSFFYGAYLMGREMLATQDPSGAGAAKTQRAIGVLQSEGMVPKQQKQKSFWWSLFGITSESDASKKKSRPKIEV